MKRLISFVLACAMCMAFMSVSAFAEVVDVGSSYPEVPEGCFGIIVDEGGNVVDSVPMPTSISRGLPYVDTVITLKPHNSLITLQYKPKSSFTVGFGHRDHQTNNLVTTPNCMLKMEIYNKASIGGGDRSFVKGDTFSTNYEDAVKYGYPMISEGDVVALNESSISSSKPYYNGKYTNLSDVTMNVQIMVWSE